MVAIDYRVHDFGGSDCSFYEWVCNEHVLLMLVFLSACLLIGREYSPTVYLVKSFTAIIPGGDSSFLV